MKVVLTQPALFDLEEIADFIGRDDSERADAFVDSLERKCMTLSSHPRRYPLVSGAAHSGLRKLAYRDYLIFYRALTKQVEVVRIVHGARDWAALLAEGN